MWPKVRITNSKWLRLNATSVFESKTEAEIMWRLIQSKQTTNSERN